MGKATELGEIMQNDVMYQPKQKKIGKVKLPISFFHSQKLISEKNKKTKKTWLFVKWLFKKNSKEISCNGVPRVSPISIPIFKTETSNYRNQFHKR